MMMPTIYRTTLALLVGAGLGCGEDRVDGGDVSDLQIKSSCQSYCDKAHVCDDEVAVSSCAADCEERMGDCMADEQANAVDDLDACAARSCDNFKGCTIGVGLQCAFGI